MVSNWTLFDNPVKVFRDHAIAMELSNAATRSTQDLTEEMRKVEVKKIFDATNVLLKDNDVILYKLCLEGRWPGALVQEDPREVWKKGTFRHRPWMMGVVANEGSIGMRFIKNGSNLEKLNEDLDANLAQILEMDEKLMSSVRGFYLNGSDTIDESNKMDFLKILNDKLFYYPFYESVRQYIQYGSNKGTPVYLTKFSYRGSQSYTSKFFGLPNDHELGVGHADDLVFLFSAPSVFPERFPKESLDAKMVEKYVDAFVEFATTGKPSNGAAVRKCNRMNFDPFCDYQEFRRKTLEVKLPTEIIQQKDDVEIVVTNSFDTEMVTFWKSLLAK